MRYNPTQLEAASLYENVCYAIDRLEELRGALGNQGTPTEVMAPVTELLERYRSYKEELAFMTTVEPQLVTRTSFEDILGIIGKDK